MSSLAGFMAQEYALRAGESPAVADALAEMEQPRTMAARLPASLPGALLSLADRFDLLMAMFALGAKPTGSSDPFGMRRAALGVVRILRARSDVASISILSGLRAAADSLRKQGVDVPDSAIADALEFTVGRFAQLLRDEGVPASLVAAVLPGASSPGQAAASLVTIGKLASDTGFQSLVAALQRIGRIVPAGTPAAYDAGLLTEPAEVGLIRALAGLPAPASEDLSTFTTAANGIVAPTNAFFDDILVMAEDPQVRAARLGLLSSVLGKAPAFLDWNALSIALSEGGVI
jgi:glycyl-tRNA synthetase